MIGLDPIQFNDIIYVRQIFKKKKVHFFLLYFFTIDIYHSI